MAGFYPDVPGYRFAMEMDGTQWFKCGSGGVVTALTSTEVTNASDTSLTTVSPVDVVNGGGNFFAVVFPEKRDIAGVYMSGQANNGDSSTTNFWEYSLDTTNGLDGAWTQMVAPYSSPYHALPGARSAIITASAGGVRGVRLKQSASGSYGTLLRTFHVYGSITAGQTSDRLALWQPVSDAEVPASWFDFGDVRQNSTATQTFRVKNLSSTQTANTARVAMAFLSDSTPSLGTQFALSLDGSTWLAQVPLGNLAPGAISPVITLRKATPLNAQPGLWEFRLFSEATSWT